MNKIICLLTVLFCGAAIAKAQQPDLPKWQTHHALYLHAGGAALGVGPGYELQLAKPGGFILGCALSLPLVHESRYKLYSPVSVSPAINLIYGRRAWKMEFSTEYNYLLEWGIPEQGRRGPYAAHKLAWMGGVRRQLPWTPLIFRANIGISVINLQRDPWYSPAASLSLGYLIGSRRAEETELPPKPRFHFGHYAEVRPGKRHTLQLQFAPLASFSVERPWQTMDRRRWSRFALLNHYQFETQWASQVGAMADLGNAGAIAGLRVGFAAGLRQVRMSWSSNIYREFPNGLIYVQGSETSIDDLQLTWEINATMRLRTSRLQPWVVQIGAFTGDVRTLRGTSQYSNLPYEDPILMINPPRYGVGPLVSVAKQFTIGKHAIEPFLSGKWNVSRLYRWPKIHQWSASAGFMFWL